ncbi:MAG: aminopeptidase P family protein [Acidaminococcus sp.]|nr:aminopeptidase P family protein [Acidaminococcus sp.]MCI2099487.1 aminopeptidase P family protein [Acidaminococcus sp.]MCI2113847.1 aminopeptidase P family protein [Acidaminococcus sp.]MCI2115579.1 aminopeptidase P family protein [Acidaminococcus sp.]
MNTLSRLRAFMEQEKVDGIFIKGDSSIRYFTGFTGGESLLYVDGKRQVIITDSRYTLQVKEEAPECELVEHHHGFWPEAAKLPTSRNLALDGDYFSYTEQQALAAALPDASWKNLNLVGLRQVKLPEEMKRIRRAIAISDEAFNQLLPHIKAGRTEMDLAAELEYNMKKLGSEKPSFDTIAASGKRSALPHGRASNKVVEKGDFLTFDFGAVFEGYCSDITRTVVIGKAAPWQKEIYDIVLNANLLGEKVLRPGLTGVEVDGKVRDYIASRGYGEYFGHGLGHGVGLDIHEKPVLNKVNNAPLPVGAVVTVEPGIYLPDRGGVRIEDTVLVTETGCEKMTSVDKALKELE